MNYVISDVHGCYDLFLRMLEKIRFSSADTLFLLGDAADRGPDGLPVLFDVMGRSNVVMHLGNHEDMFRRVIQNWENEPNLTDREAADRTFVNWTERNGGDVTWQAYLSLTEERQRQIRDFLLGLRLFSELTVNGRQFLLVHAGVGEYWVNKRPEDCELRDLIWTRMDYSRAYYTDRYLVTGHTPTVLIDPACRGRIFRGNNHIVVDCGAVYCGTLGCLCLDTMEEIYVS
ncbi:MAG: metallophosphoesterase [Oscillospiraceae bacterium]|nr:metallophosphoesterase [Oscillospiraceae bacterium]